MARAEAVELADGLGARGMVATAVPATVLRQLGEYVG